MMQDNDAHWYVIPASLEADWHRWLEEVAGDDPPDFADPVGGHPSLVTFENPNTE